MSTNNFQLLQNSISSKPRSFVRTLGGGVGWGWGRNADKAALFMHPIPFPATPSNGEYLHHIA